MRKMMSVKRLIGAGGGEVGAVCGWLRSVRVLKNVAFLDLTDGTTFAPLSVAVPLAPGGPPGTEPGFSPGGRPGVPPGAAQGASPRQLVKTLTTGQCLRLENPHWHTTPRGARELRVLAPDISVLGSVTAAYPLQKKFHTPAFLRSLGPLKHRSAYLGGLLRFRSAVDLAVGNFFAQEDFTKVNPPILTGGDCEGAGEQFRVDVAAATGSHGGASTAHYFGSSQALLTVSSQLHLEALALALSRCYTLSPCFRAEPSNTKRHLSEFWMLEAELCFTSTVHDVVRLVQRLAAHIVTSLLPRFDELIPQRGLETDRDSLRRRWTVLADTPHWGQLTYTEAVSLLQAAVQAGTQFRYAPGWGAGLQTEHERWLAEVHYGGRPVVITDYPKSCKAFYMRANDDGRGTVACFDVVVPGMGEIVGGSLREEREDRLVQEMRERGMDAEGDLAWYVALRREGSAPHGGFGLGFERFVSYLYGNTNIRDAIPFHRSAGQLDM